MTRFNEHERQSIARELWDDETTYAHRFVFDLLSDAKKAVKYLQEHGFTNVHYTYDDEARNYDLGFESDHKLSEAQQDEVYNNNFECSASAFNVGITGDF